MNEVILIGRLTRDIDIRQTTTGKTVGNFTLAVPRPRKDDTPDFIDCVAWESTADILSHYVKKGQQLAVVGHIQIRSYDKDGRKVKVMEIIVDRFDFLSHKEEPAKTIDASVDEFNIDDDDIPF